MKEADKQKKQKSELTFSTCKKTKVEEAMIRERHKYYDQMKPISWPASYKEIKNNIVVSSTMASRTIKAQEKEV